MHQGESIYSNNHTVCDVHIEYFLISNLEFMTIAYKIVFNFYFNSGIFSQVFAIHIEMFKARPTKCRNK